MKTKRIVKLFLLIVLMHTHQMMAQVTIGTETPSVKGALLQLKENDGANDNANRGIGMPRVKLNSLTIPGNGTNLAVTIDGATGTWGVEEHIGLLIYNVADDPQCPTYEEGLYVWNGSQWQQLRDDYVNLSRPTGGNDAYTGANTYIMQPRSRITIPVKRGYEIWRDYAPAITDKSQGKVLDLSDVSNLSGKLSASIVWQEDRIGGTCVLQRVSIDDPEAGQGANLLVETRDKYGNALVAVHIGPNGNATDPVLWQWQIWIPEGEPQALPTYNDGSGNSWTYMDRNLGAIKNVAVLYVSADPTTRDPHGTYYQWGRPTPMPRFPAGVLPAELMQDAYPNSGDEGKNLTLALTTGKFIRGQNDTFVDWYSTDDVWISRWGDGTADDTTPKTAFDPCPRGWRVPSWKGGLNPWNTIVPSGDVGWIGSDESFVDNQGVISIKSAIGFYAAAGLRAGQTSSLSLGSNGYYWTAMLQSTRKTGWSLGFSSLGFSANSLSSRAHGLAVRCVKE